MHFLETQHWTFPVPITYGPGSLGTIAKRCRDSGILRPLLVTDAGSSTLPFVAAARKTLCGDGLFCDLFCDVSPNPRDTQIEAGRVRFLRGDHDGIVAIGGGSSLDAGKAISLVANSHSDIWDFDYEKTPPESGPSHEFPPLICIPSTAGTGAETESTAMINDTRRGMKICIWHPQQKPALALLDPEITVGLPSNLTAWTGLDALIHAIEAYCVPAFHPLCDGLALESMRLISHSLMQAVSEPRNLEARGRMLTGSCLAGIAFLKGLGMVHAISHMVGAEYDTHHGLTNAIALPAVLRFNADYTGDKVPRMADAIGVPTRSFDALYNHICELLDQLEIPTSLKDIGVPETCIKSIAAKAMLDPAMSTNPRPATLSSSRSVLQQAIHHGR